MDKSADTLPALVRAHVDAIVSLVAPQWVGRCRSVNPYLADDGKVWQVTLHVRDLTVAEVVEHWPDAAWEDYPAAKGVPPFSAARRRERDIDVVVYPPLREPPALVAEPASDDDVDEPAICGGCAGSGEGQVDGSRCRRCGGSGEEAAFEDEPDEDVFAGEEVEHG